ncbi:phasin family protein [Massilia sp. R2A-15]|uniref:phasin family protein n=1 Tax=Massilia sp. R2A-15 TaxID=3064278 RepID=UPI002736058E|nr:phasin family protein [Massilia sp. R2A-15]WLI90722.1 phasin family protein [Massilia sp. R2A-15]
MVKKLKEMAAAEQHAMVDAVVGSAQQIWQAGLGAFARAQHEGGELFDSLVREGLDLHQLTQKMAGDKVQGVAERANRLAESVGRQASGSWDKIEKLFQDRVARSMSALGVPSHDELDALRRELAELKAQVAASASPAPAPARRTAAAKPAASAKPALKDVPIKAPVRAAPKRQAKAAARHH